MALAAKDVVAQCREKGSQFMLLPYSTDFVMPPRESMNFASELKKGGIDVHAEVIKTNLGHDAFLASKKAEMNVLRNRLSAFLRGGVKSVTREAADGFSAI